MFLWDWVQGCFFSIGSGGFWSFFVVFWLVGSFVCLLVSNNGSTTLVGHMYLMEDAAMF